MNCALYTSSGGGVVTVENGVTWGGVKQDRRD